MCQYGDFPDRFSAVFRSVWRQSPTSPLKSIDRLPKERAGISRRQRQKSANIIDDRVVGFVDGRGLSRGVRCRREPARRLLASVLHSSDSEEMFHALFF
jgi:hypothetical protein